jgi:coenzyme F420-reducing hydrogenase delta subunit
MAEAQKAMKERGIDGNRLRMAAICSVCSEPFTKHMTGFAGALVPMGPAKAR